MIEDKNEELYQEFREKINFLFMASEILDHAFTDFLGVSRKANIDKYQFVKHRNQIRHSMDWFKNLYSGALNDEQVESYGATGDELYEKLKKYYNEL